MSVEIFKQHLHAAEIIDPTGVHHEFNAGDHGQKIDFGRIEPGGQLHDEWVGVTVDALDRLRFDRGLRGRDPMVLLSVAYGTNRLTLDVAEELSHTTGFETYKDSFGKARLTKAAAKLLEFVQPTLTVVLEDVGTTGDSALNPACEAKQIVGPRLVEVLTTWKRSQTLEKLRNAGIVNTAIIFEPLPTFRPDECASQPDGFCARGWELKTKNRC